MSQTHKRWLSTISIPAPPSRDKVLGFNISFMGGIVVDSIQYGKMPWYDPCLPWCDEATRNIAYQKKKEAGDTAAILFVPSGSPLYNEPGQFYSPDKFGPLDWTSELTGLSVQFDDLLIEIISNGFTVLIAMDEDAYKSLQIIKLVAQRLKDLGLTKYCVSMPGFDGVFYGWQPEWIANWGVTARAINEEILLALEFQPGEIPLGNGPKDYDLDGLMEDFDLILSETRWPPDPTIWAVFGRCLLTYKVPTDQNSDFPPVPFYLIDSARGKRFFNGFETDYPYYWVRANMNDQSAINNAITEINKRRNYFINCGSTHNG